MPMTFESLGQHRFRVPCDGDFEVEDVRKVFEAIAECEEPSAKTRVMIDDERSNFNPSSEELRQIVSTWARVFRGAPVRIALVVRRAHHFGLGRMIDVFAEDVGLQFRVFKDRESAEEWLSS